MRPFLLALTILLAGLGLSTSTFAADWTLTQLMQDLAKSPSAHVRFTEVKKISILDHPVESSGELFYQAPDRLEKRTLLPRPETMLLEGDTLFIERGKKKQQLSLQSYPQIAAFVDSIRATLAGDQAALERTYQLTLQGDVSNWKLALIPIKKDLRRIVDRIRISGNGDQVRSIVIEQTDGDSSLMTIEAIPSP